MFKNKEKHRPGGSHPFFSIFLSHILSLNPCKSQASQIKDSARGF